MINVKALAAKKRRLDEKVAAIPNDAAVRSTNAYLKNPILSPSRTLQEYLVSARKAALEFVPQELRKLPITDLCCEIEARLGVLKVTNSSPARRVTSSGAKAAPDGSGVVIPAFDCRHSRATMVAGISRCHFVRWTSSGSTESNPIYMALGLPSNVDAVTVRREIDEKDTVETVYTGFENHGRLVFEGLHPPADVTSRTAGKLETKAKLSVFDMAVPAAPYDIRVTLSSEKTIDPAVLSLLPGWKSCRIKRRRSFSRVDHSIVWKIDVTEVTTISAPSRDATNSLAENTTVEYEIETELQNTFLLQLVNEENLEEVNKAAGKFAAQLWWILSHLNPSADALDVETTLQQHRNHEASALALAHCAALRSYMSDVNKTGHGHFVSPIVTKHQELSNGNGSGLKIQFPGCMPVNFSRRNLDDIQRQSDASYYLSEKTDGVRHFLIFTGLGTAVLVDRAMRCKQPRVHDEQEPFRHVIHQIQPGTILDGEVVMNRRGGKPRPIFIAFDVLAISVTQPVLQLPFEKRLYHLQSTSFAVTSSPHIFDNEMVSDATIPLPLVLKNFVKRTQVDRLLSYVKEEKGMRFYRNGDAHFHLTDGIIFQPNLPYVLGTDTNLLKWKYLDTVTIDVEVFENNDTDLHIDNNGHESSLLAGVMGPEGTSVDVSRFIHLPRSERLRLEADRYESNGCRIAEIGFEPEIGEWYYLTMRRDKVAPNHISTVLGTLLELSESLTTEELRFRMSIPLGVRDTYRKDMRGMLKQLLDHQRKKLHGSKT
jgi:hypothetical protein